MCGCCASSPCAARAFLASRRRSPGGARSRESLTQDSRSAVKARLFDPLRESFGERRCTPCKAGVAASKRPLRGFEPAVTRRNAAQMQRGGRCARTSLAVTPACDDAQTSAMRARYGLTPRRVASSRLATHERREGLCARTACWRRSRGRAQGDGRAMRAFLCRHHRLRWQRSGQRGDAMVPVVLTGMRGGRNVESAHGHRAAPTILRLHQA